MPPFFTLGVQSGFHGPDLSGQEGIIQFRQDLFLEPSMPWVTLSDLRVVRRGAVDHLTHEELNILTVSMTTFMRVD